MNKIDVTGIVEITETSKNSDWYFTDEWNFKIGEYSFKKISEKELNVSFYFYANLIKIEKGLNIGEIPSEHTNEFQETEENLEIILDLLTIKFRVGLKIRKDSYKFSSLTGRNEAGLNKLKLEIDDIEGIQKRFQSILQNKKNNKRLIAGLRLFRYSLWYSEPTEKVLKLYTILEQVFGGGEGGNLLTDDELKKINEFFIKQGYDEIKIEILQQRLKSTPAKSINEILIERIGLMNSEGIISDDEKRKLFSYWRSQRSKPAHGTILPKRGKEIILLIHELESTIEALLYTKLKPKMLYYILFKKNDIDDSMNSKGKLISELDNEYRALAIRNDEKNIYLNTLPHHLTNTSSYFYFISHDTVTKITKTNTEKINLDTIINPLKSYVLKIINKLN